MAIQNRRLSRCTNCDAELNPEEDAYCRHCGQKNKDRKVPFWIPLWEYIEEEFDLDSKLGRTLKLFFLRPGRLTQLYRIGKRADYIPPLKLFFVTGFISFFVMAVSIKVNIAEKDSQKPTEEVSQVTSNDSIVQDTTGESFVGFSLGGEEELGEVFQFNIADEEEALASVENPVEAYLLKSAIEAEKNPSELFGKMLEKTPIVLLVVLPVLAIALRIVYWKENIYLVEHMAFLYHTHSFLFVMLTVSSLIAFLGAGVLPIFMISIFGSSLYFLLALKGFYANNWGWTVLKFSFLGLMYITIVPVFWLATSIVISLIF